MRFMKIGFCMLASSLGTTVSASDDLIGFWDFKAVWMEMPS